MDFSEFMELFDNIEEKEKTMNNHPRHSELGLNNTEFNEFSGTAKEVPGKYQAIGTAIGILTDSKNEAYGDSFNECATFLKLLYPNGVSPNQYTDMLCIVRIFDKLKRIATKKRAFGESPYKDIGGYALLGIEKDMREYKQENDSENPSAGRNMTEMEKELYKLVTEPQIKKICKEVLDRSMEKSASSMEKGTAVRDFTKYVSPMPKVTLKDYEDLHTETELKKAAVKYPYKLK